MLAYINKSKIGVFSFLIVLFFMPIGHTLMVLNENVLKHSKFMGAFGIGVLGVICLFIGILKNHNQAISTFLGFLSGVLVWTGWVEFSFVWMAEKLNVAPLMENGEIATKPEYLVMMSSLGLLVTFLAFFVFRHTNCQFFNWFQRNLRYKEYLKHEVITHKTFAVLTFIETIVILWSFYILLLLVYDKDIAGDKHPATYIVAFGSLFWSIYLMLNLIKVQKFDYAIRYAIPTVIIFWNFIEVIGRWDLMKEIWVHPFEHWLENLIIFSLMISFVGYYVYETFNKNSQKTV